MDKAIISKLENLAKLSLSNEERELLNTDLENILEMVDKIQEVDVTNVKPLIHMSEEVNVTRKDIAEQPLDQDLALDNAPEAGKPFFKVPNVMISSKKKMQK